MMSRIYVTARHVIAYTGEGTAQTDRLLDWINGLDQHDLNIPSMGKFQDINVANLGMLSGPAQLWNGLGATKVWINEAATKSERFWNTIKARYFSPPQDSGPHPKIVLSRCRGHGTRERVFLWALVQTSLGLARNCTASAP